MYNSSISHRHYKGEDVKKKFPSAWKNPWIILSVKPSLNFLFPPNVTETFPWYEPLSHSVRMFLWRGLGRTLLLLASVTAFGHHVTELFEIQLLVPGLIKSFESCFNLSTRMLSQFHPLCYALNYRTWVLFRFLQTSRNS